MAVWRVGTRPAGEAGDLRRVSERKLGQTQCGSRWWRLLLTACPSFTVYGVELFLKVAGLGPVEYLSSGWNL